MCVIPYLFCHMVTYDIYMNIYINIYIYYRWWCRESSMITYDIYTSAGRTEHGVTNDDVEKVCFLKVQACLSLIFTRCGAFSRPAQSARVIHTYWKFVTGSLSQHIIIYIFLITCIIFSCRYYQTMCTKLIQLWRGKGSNARTCTSMWSDSWVWYIAEIHNITCLWADFHSTSTQHGNLYQPLVTTSRVICFISHTSTGNCISHNQGISEAGRGSGIN